MPTVDNLNHQTIKGLTADGDFTEYWEQDFPRGSFGVRVSGRTGKKTFVIRYYNRHGEKRRVTLGAFAGDEPDGLSLAQARDNALQILGDVAGGEDPAEENKHNGPATVRELIELFLEKHGEKISETTRADYRRYFEKDVLPRWGEWNPEEVTRSDVVQVLDHIAYDRNGPVTSNRTRAALHKLFNFAINRGLLTDNPVRGVPRRGRETSRDRVLEDDEIRTLLTVLEEEPPVTSHLFRLLLLTGQRLGETRRARWTNINGDAWIIPSGDAKNNRTHHVPLSDPARTVLEEVQEITGDTDYVFASPSPRKENEPIRYLQDATVRIREEAGFYFRIHDLRRTAASGMARLVVDRMTISKVLNHKSADASITAVYDRYDRQEEKRNALEAWGDHVNSLREESDNE